MREIINKESNERATIPVGIVDVGKGYRKYMIGAGKKKNKEVLSRETRRAVSKQAAEYGCVMQMSYGRATLL